MLKLLFAMHHLWMKQKGTEENNKATNNTFMDQLLGF